LITAYSAERDGKERRRWGIGGDGVHPTDGHKYLAQKITPLIQNASGS
jgi:hypothetical protein